MSAPGQQVPASACSFSGESSPSAAELMPATGAHVPSSCLFKSIRAMMVVHSIRRVDHHHIVLSIVWLLHAPPMSSARFVFMLASLFLYNHCQSQTQSQTADVYRSLTPCYRLTIFLEARWRRSACLISSGHMNFRGNFVWQKQPMSNSVP